MTDDYISRQAALDDLHTQLMYRMGSDDMKRRLDDWVATLPSADVVPVVHGRWIDADFCGQYECSECGNNAVDLYDFCPNCGAKMDGGET